MLTIRSLLPVACAIALSLAASSLEARPRHHAAPVSHTVPTHISTIDLAEPVHAALAAQASGRRVIVVFDIDNTLLTMPQDLGSDTWFNWQKAQENGDAHQFNDLLTNSTVLLQLGRMKPTQPAAGALVQSLQAAHVPVFALSARSPGLRGPTEEALSVAGIDLTNAPECGRPLCSRRGHLGDAEIRAALHRLHMAAPDKPFRTVTVSDGVMMVSGQNKGTMLHLLLASLKGRYDEVYFVDDTFKNITDVEAAAPAMTTRVHTYSYERLWPDTRDFISDTARQAKADADMAKLKAGVCAAIEAAACAAR